MKRRDCLRMLRAVTNGSVSGKTDPRNQEAERLRLQAKPWLSSPGVQGTGIGEKVTDGEKRDLVSLKVYVEKKLPEDSLDYGVPKSIRWPGGDLEIVTDVVEIGKVRLQSLTEKVRPVKPGCAVRLAGGDPGTLGCVVTRPQYPGNLYLLSASHVIGDFGAAFPGQAIFQPGEDGMDPTANRIATFVKALDLEFDDERFLNFGEGAIARLPWADPVFIDPTIDSVGLPTGQNPFPRRGDRVQKVGAASDRTSGEILDIDHSLAAFHKDSQGRWRRAGFQRLVLCKRFTDPGDSGALVLSSTGKALGLHIAGSDSVSIFCRIGPVLAGLQARLLTAKARN